MERRVSTDRSDGVAAEVAGVSVGDVFSTADSHSGSRSGSLGNTGLVTANNNMNSKINKQFGTLPENLQLNGITPSGKPRLFVCKVCTRAFARQEHLTRHERSHTKEKPYVCGICDRRFTRRDLLIRHAQKLHGGNCGDTIRQTSRKVKSGSVSGPSASRRHSQSETAGQSQSGGAVTEHRVRKISLNLADSRVNTVNLAAALRPDDKKNKRRSLYRRVSFSAQSGENYAVLPASTTSTKENPERVDFSTPQMLPLDLLDTVPQVDQPSDFNLLDRNNWINDFNNAVIPSNDDPAQCNSSPNSNNTRNSSWEVQGDTLKINSLFSFPMSHSDSHQSNTDWKTLATALKPEPADLLSLSPLPQNTLDSTLITNSTEQITSSLSNFQLKFEGNGLENGNPAVGINHGAINPITLTHNGIPTESPPLRTGSGAKNEFKFMPSEFTPSNDPFDNLPKKNINDPYDNEYNIAMKNNTAPLLPVDDDTAGTRNNENGFTPHPSTSGNANKNGLHNTDSGNDIDPVQLQSIMDPGYTFYDVQYSNQYNISKASPGEHDVKISFFNDDIRYICQNALNHYANICSSDYKPCTLTCSNDELNTYLKLYLLRFHPHNPFIHSSIWTLDYQSYRSYIYEKDSNGIPSIDDESIYYTNIICLPLFAATIGSLFKNTSSSSSNKTKELYEISRRVLHVYLDRRKNLKKSDVTTSLNSNLWLIQSLTLSVMYSIFAEHSTSTLNRSDQILKQVGAVCSLLRNYFLPLVQSKPKDLNSDAAIIIWESKLRTTLTNYSLCQFLQIFQRLSSSSFITNRELQSIIIPNNEARWSALSFNWSEEAFSSTKLYHSNFLNFFQSFQYNELGFHPIPEFLVNSMLFYEYSQNLAGSNINVFINKIDTKKLEKNLPSVDKNSPTSEFLIGDCINLKNSLISLRLFDKLDPNFFRIISKYGLTDDLFENCLSPIHGNVLSKDSNSLIIDLLVSVNVSIKNIASLFYFTNDTGYYHEIKFDYSKTSMFQIQGYFYNFLCILKFILDFESTPNFKVLSIFAELRKVIEQLMIPRLINNYPLEFSKFTDLDLSYENQHARSFNLQHLEKTIESVLVQSFNDYNFLKMPSNSSTTTNQFDFNSANADSGPMPSKSSINLLRHHETCKQNGARIKQGFYDRYHLSDKLLQVAKCSFLLIYESHVHGSLLFNFIENINVLQSKLDDQRKITSIIINQSNIFGSSSNSIPNPNSFTTLLNGNYSNTPPGDYYFNPNSL